MSSNKIKSKQLGMNFSTASHRLKKNYMLKLARECGKDICFRCKRKIENYNDFSIDHIKDWLHSENGKNLFWDVDNIALSHKSCNIKAGLDKRTKNREITKIKGRNKQYQVRKWDGKKQVLIGYYSTIEEAEQAKDSNLAT